MKLAPKWIQLRSVAELNVVMVKLAMPTEGGKWDHYRRLCSLVPRRYRKADAAKPRHPPKTKALDGVPSSAQADHSILPPPVE